jgi:hypothetical protein
VSDASNGIYNEIADYNDEYYSVILNTSQRFDIKNLVWLTNNGERKLDLGRDPGWKKIISEGFFDKKNFPWIIVNGNTDLLSKHRLSCEQMEALKGKHLAIFMFEPLFLRDRHGSYPQNRGSGTPLNSVELDSVQHFLENHNNGFTSTVFTCDFGIGEYLHSHGRYTNLDIKTFDTFLISENYHYVRDLEDFSAAKEFSRRVICPNYRYNSARELMVSYICGRGFQNNTYLSFFHMPKKERLLVDVPFLIERTEEWDILNHGFEVMREQVPFILDTSNSMIVDQDEHPIPDMKEGFNKRSTRGIRDLYRHSFVALANETNFFSPCPEISEKVMTPIGVGRPFIVAGAPHSLRHLKVLGFKTFDDFWDESYDEEKDPYLRLKKIWKLLDWIYSLNSSELQELDRRMRPVLLYNHQFLYHEFMSNQSRRLDELVERSPSSCDNYKKGIWHKIKGLLE